MNKKIKLNEIVNDMLFLIENKVKLPSAYELQILDQNIVCRIKKDSNLISIIISPYHSYNQITIVIDGLQIFIPKRVIKLKRNSLQDLIEVLASYGFSYKNQKIIKHMFLVVQKKSRWLRVMERYAQSNDQ